MATNIANAQQLLWEGLFELEATGLSGFEGFLSAALWELTGQPFHVVKSGAQGGSDVRSEPCNLVKISLEAKKYGRDTRLQLDALLHKLTETSTANQPADLWILATTRAVDSSNREKLHAHGNNLGIGVVVWDSPQVADFLCDLSAVCGAAPQACQTHLRRSTKLDEALEIIRGHVCFESKSSYWRQRLVKPDVGYASSRGWCRQWLEDAQGSLADAKSRLGGHHDLKSSRYGVVRRSAINGELAAWFADQTAGVAALVGDEGMGKSWAALDWCDEVWGLLGPEAPMIVFLPAKRVKGVDAKSDIAGAISRQTERGSAEFWRHRLDLWERSGREDVRILVIIDGLNQNFLFRDWSDWAQPLLEEAVRDRYSLLVTCWPNWWKGELLSLRNLEPEPAEITVGKFNDEELDELLAAMNVRRKDLPESVLRLMRAPRLSEVALAKREAIAESGDVTAERVIYEDWKDRIRRSGQATGLDDVRMKAFVEELGRQLLAEVNRAVSRRHILEILSFQSGRTGEELQAAIAQLTSGGWFRAGDRPDTFKLETDRVPYVLGVTLMSELKRNYGSRDVSGIIAEFLDPLKANSLGAQILRAATTIALVEADTPEDLRQELATRWLDEQNFGAEDFEALWRLAGLDAELVFRIAQYEWLGAHASGLKDEVLIKTLANAAEFPNFNEALKAKLVEWLGTAWPVSLAASGDDGRHGSDEIPWYDREPEAVRSRLDDWMTSVASNEFVPVRLRDKGQWDWLGHRAVAVMSFLARAPYTAVLEAWALSRALMQSPQHLDEIAWILRINPEDPDDAEKALGTVIGRFDGHSHAASVRAASLLRRAMNHTRRADCLPEADVFNCGDQRRPVQLEVEKLEGDALFKAAEDYLSPGGWKRYNATTGAAIVDALIEHEVPAGGQAMGLLSDVFREIFTIIAPKSRSILRATFERERETALAGDTPQLGLAETFGFMALLLQLFDAPVEEQSRLLLASEHAVMEPEWLGICHSPKAGDLGELSISAARRAALLLWLEYVGQLLDKTLICSIEFLPLLVTHEDVEIRRRAVQIASHGPHVAALIQFSESRYASPLPSEDKRNTFEEYARNQALMDLESIRPGAVWIDQLAEECAALRVKRGDDSDAALDAFESYLANELEAAIVSSSWSSNRYWFSYVECVKLLVERKGKPIIERLTSLTERAAHRVDHVLMNNFPVLDTIRALQEQAPEVTLTVFHTLKHEIGRSLWSREAIDGLPFELSRSAANDDACDQQLAAAVTDKELLDIAYFCHKCGRVDWLLERIATHEASDRPADVAKAFTLLGCCDVVPAANALWEEFSSRPPEDEWLLRVFRESRNDYNQNRRARSALDAFRRTDSHADARHAWKLLEETCDRRISLWITDIEAKFTDWPYPRQLARNLGVRGIHQAIKKDRDRRKKRLFHTQIPFSKIAPWS